MRIVKNIIFEIHNFWDYFYIFVLKQEFWKKRLGKSQIALVRIVSNNIW